MMILRCSCFALLMALCPSAAWASSYSQSGTTEMWTYYPEDYMAGKEVHTELGELIPCSYHTGCTDLTNATPGGGPLRTSGCLALGPYLDLNDSGNLSVDFEFMYPTEVIPFNNNMNRGGFHVDLVSSLAKKTLDEAEVVASETDTQLIETSVPLADRRLKIHLERDDVSNLTAVEARVCSIQEGAQIMLRSVRITFIHEPQ